MNDTVRTILLARLEAIDKGYGFAHRQRLEQLKAEIVELERWIAKDEQERKDLLEVLEA